MLLAKVLGEVLVEVFAVFGNRAHREDGVSERLELLEDVVVQTWIVVVRATDHEQSHAVFGFHLVEDLAAAVFHLAVVLFQSLPRLILGPIALVLSNSETLAEDVEHELLHAKWLR